MSLQDDLLQWLDEHREIVLDLVRIYLGIGLFVRGILFISSTEGVAALADLSGFSFSTAVVAHYVTFAHLLGGLLLAVGLLTRLVTVLQIPILAGAVFFIHWNDGLLSATQSLEFSALVLFLLFVVLVFGAGRWSADYYVFVREPELQEGYELEPWWRTTEEPNRQPLSAGASADGATPVEVAAQAKGSAANRTEVDTCQCGHDLHHPRITAEPHYGWSAGFFFMLGISAPVKEVLFYCERCGTVLKESRDPEITHKYRWHTS